jgi:DNA primase
MSGFISKDDITSGVLILDLTEEFGISTEDVSSGNFNKRCRCPSPNHKNGGERTGSLYIDGVHNNFYCFGCGTGSNSIDFYMLCAGVTFGEAVSKLRTRVKPGTSQKESNIEISNLYTLLQISNLFRETMLKHKNDLRWIDRLMRHADNFILELEPQDENGAKKLLEKIEQTIKNRYEES